MGKRKVVNIDKELATQADYPKVKNAPEGYPALLGMKGKTWYDRAKAYEAKYGKPVTPIKAKEEEKNNG